MLTPPRRLAIAIVTALVVTIIGVFVVDLTTGGGGDTPADTPTSDPAAPSADAGGDAAELDIVDFAFDPSPATVTAGTALTIVNEDSAKHTVTSGTRDDAGKEFDVDVAPGATEELVLDEPGTYEYICRIHPGMKGTLEVVAP